MLEIAYFLKFVARLRIRTITAFVRQNYDAVQKALKREEARREYAPLSDAAMDVATADAVRLVALLNRERCIWKSSRAVSIQVLDFPGPRESEDNVKRMITVIKSATTSLDVCMYSFTLCEFAIAVVEVFKKPGLKVRVMVDYAHMSANGVQVRKMVDAGVPVYVHSANSFMKHDKFAIIDGRVSTEGRSIGLAMASPAPTT